MAVPVVSDVFIDSQVYSQSGQTVAIVAEPSGERIGFIVSFSTPASSLSISSTEWAQIGAAGALAYDESFAVGIESLYISATATTLVNDVTGSGKQVIHNQETNAAFVTSPSQQPLLQDRSVVSRLFSFPYSVASLQVAAYEFAYSVYGIAPGTRIVSLPYRIHAIVEKAWSIPWRICGPFTSFRLIKTGNGIANAFDFAYMQTLTPSWTVVPYHASAWPVWLQGLRITRQDGLPAREVILPVSSSEWAAEAVISYRPGLPHDEGGMVVWGEGQRRYVMAISAPYSSSQTRLRLTYRDGVISGWSSVGSSVVYHGSHRIGSASAVGFALLGDQGEDLWVQSMTLYASGHVTVDGLFPGMTVQLVDDRGIIVAKAEKDESPESITLGIAHRPWPAYGRLQVYDWLGHLISESPQTSFVGGDQWAFTWPLELYLDCQQRIDPSEMPVALSPGAARRLRLVNPIDVPTPAIRVRLSGAEPNIDPSSLQVRLHLDDMGQMIDPPSLSLDLGSIQASGSIDFWIRALPDNPDIPSRLDFALVIEVMR